MVGFAEVSASAIVGHADATAHHAGILPDDVQSESAAFLLLSVGFLNEAVEDVLLVVHADAGVGHAECHLLPVDLQVYGHGAVVDVVFIGIREQVGDDAAHLVLVEVDFDGLLR